MNIRYPIYEGVYRILTFFLSVEELCQQPVPVRMTAYLQYRVQQCGDVYGSALFPWREFDGRFRDMVLSSCRYRHWYLYRCRRRS